MKFDTRNKGTALRGLGTTWPHEMPGHVIWGFGFEPVGIWTQKESFRLTVQTEAQMSDAEILTAKL